jgi:ribonuclease Y
LVLIICCLVSAGITSVISTFLSRSRVRSLLQSTEEENKKALEEAGRDADEALQTARDEMRSDFKKRKKKFEDEIKQRRSETQKIEKKIRSREQSLDQKLKILEGRESALKQIQGSLEQEEKRYKRLIQEYEQSLESSQKTLEKISGLTTAEAKAELVRSLESKAREEARETLSEIEEKAKQEADRKSQTILTNAVQKMAGSFVNDAAITVVNLPSDEVKGRIIGREGRNIRAIEQSTGVDLIIDDTPEVLIISCFNPMRREIAKLALEQLIEDGRIHPARITETVKKIEEDFDNVLMEYGEKAAFDLGVSDMNPELIFRLGKLQFRSNGRQSVLNHSVETAYLASLMANEIGLDANIAKRMGLLHKVGMAEDQEFDGHHADIGAEICSKFHEPAEVCAAIRMHCKDELESASPYALLLRTANEISTARPGARKDRLKSYIQRLQNMETAVEKFSGVEKAYVMQAGREVAVMVEPAGVTDADVKGLSQDIAHTLRSEFSFPGQVRVTVVRENRSVDTAT